MDISWLSGIKIRRFKDLNSSTHLELQHLWRAQEYKRSFSIQKPWCKLGGEFCFLIWWELIIIGNPIIKKKSKRIGEIFSIIFNLLIFILYILSLKLPFFMLNRREKKSDRGIIPLPSFFLFSFRNSLRMNN
jgi:hypothetical protein